MEKKTKVIRDLSLVENELSSIQSGVLAVAIQKDTLTQFATNFVYQNKNIFVFITNDELLRTIKFNSPAKFTILKEKNTLKELRDEQDPYYRLFYIVVTGLFREVEEKKIINDIKQSYIEKYSGKLLINGKATASLGKLYFIDSEELLAFDEIGL
ncbi:MAG: hypothetical protein KJN64_05525 [Ignavibacteria bacterium]|nr:hypothetical protein [Ignavibacteria bacterium]MBT8392452.1 hypothetical protein [Ignavibacteria bacterium]NNJ53515.1 hypothetical protein [Ignavibacteriaceae bacterium]